MTLDQRKAHVKKNWTYIDTNCYTYELLRSNDGEYIFKCKFQLGSLEADGNLNVRW